MLYLHFNGWHTMTERYCILFHCYFCDFNFTPAVRSYSAIRNIYHFHSLLWFRPTEHHNQLNEKWVIEFNMIIFHISYCVKFYKTKWKKKTQKKNRLKNNCVYTVVCSFFVVVAFQTLIRRFSKIQLWVEAIAPCTILHCIADNLVHVNVLVLQQM